MKKVGIITIIDYKNYGNRLQNYATQEVLKSLGFETITIVNSPNKRRSRVKLIYKIRGININKIIYYFKKIKHNLYKSSEEKKHIELNEERIKSFNSLHIKIL